MYESYWHLDRRPFDVNIDPTFHYPSQAQQGTLLKLRYTIENHRGAALLAGTPGTGKTHLVRMLEHQLDATNYTFLHMVFPQMTPGELLAYVADELGAPAADSAQRSVDQSIRRIEHQLAANLADARHTVLAIDEAHLLADCETLETIRLLLNFDAANQSCLTLLLVGQVALLPAVERLPALGQRFAIQTLVEPFSLEETAAYVNHRLAVAGAPTSIFTAEAIEAIHTLTQGTPRAINHLGDLALLVGFAEQMTTLDREHIEQVNGELSTVVA